MRLVVSVVVAGVYQWWAAAQVDWFRDKPHWQSQTTTWPKYWLISAPSYESIIFLSLVLSVCPSVCHKSCFFFFCFSMESSHFMASSSPWQKLQNIVLRFLICCHGNKIWAIFCQTSNWFFFVSRWNQAILAFSSPWHPQQNFFLRFLIYAKTLFPKICTKSPISRLLWQIDRRCLGLPWGFRGWPIQ